MSEGQFQSSTLDNQLNLIQNGGNQRFQLKYNAVCEPPSRSGSSISTITFSLA